MEKFTEVVKLAPQQGIFHFDGQNLELAQRLHCLCFSTLVAINLILNDVTRHAHRPGIAEKEIVLQLVNHIEADLEWINDYAVRQKLDVVKAAEGSGILILQPPLNAQLFTLDDACKISDFVVGER